MRMIMRTALAVGLTGALVLGSAGVSHAAPTATPVTTVDHNDGLGGLLGNLLGDGDDDNDGLLGGLLGNVLGDDDDNDDGDHHVKVTCDDSDADTDGAELLNVEGLNLVAILNGVNVLGLNLGNCGDDSEGLLGGLLGDDNDDEHDGLLGGLLDGLLGLGDDDHEDSPLTGLGKAPGGPGDTSPGSDGSDNKVTPVDLGNGTHEDTEDQALGLLGGGLGGS